MKNLKTIFTLPPGRNFGLDFLRAFSITLVLLQHNGINIPGLAPMKIGTIGVEIFFVLSGFLIGGILFRDLDKQERLVPTLRTFWTRRWLRILPLYYAVLLFKFIVLDHSPGWNILYYFGFLQNNFYGISFLPVSWSLVIEEWFYIFVPLFLFVLIRRFRATASRVTGLVLFLVVINVLRYIYVTRYDTPFQGVNSNVPFRLDSLFVGVFIAYLHHFHPAIYGRMNKGYVFATGLLGAVAYIFYYWLNSRGVNQIDELLFPRTLGFFVLPLAVSLTIPWIASRQWTAQGPLARFAVNFVSWVSILTYGIYLIHPFVIEFLQPLTGFWAFVRPVLFAGLTFLLAFLVYTFFEHPILRLRDRLTLGKKGTDASKLASREMTSEPVECNK